MAERLRITNAGYVGIGTAAPNYLFDVDASNASPVMAVMNRDSATGQNPTVAAVNYMGAAATGFPVLNLLNLRGTFVGPTSAVQSGDVLGEIYGSGSTGAGQANAMGANIAFGATQTWSGSAHGSYVAVSTTTNGAGAVTERMRIDQNGNVGIGTATPLSKLDVAGGMAVGAYAGTLAAPANDLIVSNAIGIGTATPGVQLDIAGNDASPVARLINYSSTAARYPAYAAYNFTGGNAGYPSFQVFSGRGNSTTPAALQSGDVIGAFVFNGYGSSSTSGTGASIQAFATNSTWTSSSTPGSLVLFTTPLGATAATERMRVTDSGGVGIGTTSPQAALDVATTGTGGSAILVPRDTSANRPTVAVNGMIRYNTTNSKLEGYVNGSWQDFSTAVSGTNYLSTTGGTLSGSLTVAAGGENLTGGLNNNSGGIINAGSITGVGTTLTGAGALTVAAGGTNQNLTLSPSGTGNIVLSPGFVGIGTSAPDALLTVSGNTSLQAPTAGTVLHVVGADATKARITVDTFMNGNGRFSSLNLRTARGTAAAPSGLLAGDQLGLINGLGWGTTGFFNGANIVMNTTEAWTDTKNGSNITFTTIPNGTNVGATAMTIDNTGNVGIGTTTPGNALAVRSSTAAQAQFNGYSSIIGGADASGGSIIIGNSPSYEGIIDYTDGGWSTMTIKNTYNGALALMNFDMASTHVMSLMGSGNVGVGTTAPSAPLEVVTADTIGAQDKFLAKFGRSSTDAVNDTDLIGIGTGANTGIGAANNGVSFDLGFYTRSSYGTVSSANERMRISSAGNVGIGTTTPGQALDINGGVQLRGIAAPATSGAGQAAFYFDSTSKTLRLSQNGGPYTNLYNPVLTPNTAGGGSGQWVKVAVANITGQYGYVNATVRLLGGYTDSSRATAATVVWRVKQQNAMGAATYVTVDLLSSTDPAFGPGDVASVETTNSGAATIAELWVRVNHYYETFNVQPVDTFTAVGTIAFADSFTAAYSASLPGGTTVYGAASSFTASTNGVAYTNGNVGIGTAAPGTLLDVNGIATVRDYVSIFNAGNTGQLFMGNLANSGRYLYENWDEGAGTATIGTGAGYPLIFAVSSTETMRISAAGKVGIGINNPTYLLQLGSDSAAKPGTSTWTIASDSRLKDIRAPFTRGLEAIEEIHPIYFKYKQDNPLGLPSDKEYVGIVAQDAQKAVPEAVHADDQGFLHLTNDSIIWTMLNGIKELYAKFTVQDRAIASLKSENETLKQENAQIKAYLCAKDPNAPICK